MKKPEAITRKTLILPDTLWAQISSYRFTEQISTEAEAVRRLLQAAIDGLPKKGKAR